MHDDFEKKVFSRNNSLEHFCIHSKNCPPLEKLWQEINKSKEKNFKYWQYSQVSFLDLKTIVKLA